MDEGLYDAASPSKPWFQKLWPILFFGLVTLLSFWKVLLHREFTLLAGGDMSAQTYPWFNVAAYWLKRGVILLWDPYVYSGKANLGELQTGALYPLNWIFMLLPARGGGVNVDGLQILLVLNYLLAGYFAFLLARSFGQQTWGALVAGVGFCVGGYMATLHAWVNIFSAFIWMPLIILLFRKALLSETRKARRCRFLWCALVMALSFLAGHHAPAIQTGLFLVFYAVFALIRNRETTSAKAKLVPLLGLGSVALVAALLASVQLLPSLEWGRQVLRWVGEENPVRWGEKIPFSVLERTHNVTPQDLVSTLMPYMSSSGANIYVGIILLFLALCGFLFVRNSEGRFLGVAAFLFLFLSWGRFSAFNGWLYTFIPGLWFAREIYLYLIPFQLCLALLAGYGLDHLIESYSGRPERDLVVFIRRIGWGMASLVVCAGIAIVAAHWLLGQDMNDYYLSSAAGLAVYTMLLGTLLFLLHSGRIRPRVFGCLAIALVVLDLASHFSASVQPVDRPAGLENLAIKRFWKIPPAAAYLKDLRQREFFRVDDPLELFPPNFGDAWRLEQTMGHAATALARYFDFRGIGWDPGSNASALLNVRYFLSRERIPGMKTVFEEGVPIHFSPRAVPRAFVASRYRSFGSDEEILSWIRSPLFSPRETVVFRDDDVNKLSTEFLKSAVNEREELEAHAVSYWMVSEKERDRVTDPELKNKLTTFHAPWGWSTGDEMDLSIRVTKPVSECFLIVSYYPTSRETSSLSLRIEGPDSASVIPVSLPGFEGLAEKSDPGLRKLAVSFGALSPGDCRVFFTKTGACSANLDSLRVSSSRLATEERPAGLVTITSFKPNRIRLNAELNRPSFVVMSELNYPGWEALVDGQPAPVLTGDYLLRVVPVPAGKHDIVLRFRSRSFQIGLIVSLATLASLLFFQFRWR